MWKVAGQSGNERLPPQTFQFNLFCTWVSELNCCLCVREAFFITPLEIKRRPCSNGKMCILVNHVVLMWLCLLQKWIEVEMSSMASFGNREFSKQHFISLPMSLVPFPRQCLRAPHYLFACVAWRADTSSLPFLPNFSPQWSKAIPVLLSRSLTGTSMPPSGLRDCLTGTLRTPCGGPLLLLIYWDWLLLSQCVIATSGWPTQDIYQSRLST